MIEEIKTAMQNDVMMPGLWACSSVEKHLPNIHETLRLFSVNTHTHIQTRRHTNMHTTLLVLCSSQKYAPYLLKLCKNKSYH